MSFLRINGLEIPCADKSPRVSPQDIGSEERSFSGSLLSDRRARKRIWTVRTAPLKEIEALAIEGAVAGLGEVIPFDFTDSARLTTDFFGSKGVGPGSTVGGMQIIAGADGDPVRGISTVINLSKGGRTGAGTCEAGTTNILSADQRDAEGTYASSYTDIVGGTGTVVTTDKMQGSQSVRVVTAAGGDGIETQFVAASAATAYKVSVYVKITTASRQLKIELIDDVGSIGSASPTIDAQSQWIRVAFTGTTAGGATTIKMRITDNVAGGTTFFLDCFQIELLGVVGSAVSVWIDGVRAAGNLAYNASPFLSLPSADMTFNAWVHAPLVAPVADTHLITFSATDTDGNTHGVKINRPAGASGDVRFITEDPGGVDTLLSGTFLNSTFKMLTCVIRGDPETGENGKEIWVNGLLDGSTASPTTAPDLSLFTSFDMGHNAGVDFWGHGQYFSEVQVLPWAASPAQILAWFNSFSAVAMPGSRRALIDGDIMSDPQLVTLVQGKVESSFIAAGVSTGGIRNNLRQLTLTLLEL